MLHNLRLQIAAVIFAASPLSANEPNAWIEWVAANAPHGVDITPDGTVWINLLEPGLKDDYAVRAGDLREARETSNKNPKFWVRGYHIKNKDVTFRESKTQYQLSCANEQIKTLLIAHYDASGNLLFQSTAGPYETIIPGTYGSEYYRLFCLVSK